MLAERWDPLAVGELGGASTEYAHEAEALEPLLRAEAGPAAITELLTALAADLAPADRARDRNTAETLVAWTAMQPH